MAHPRRFRFGVFGESIRTFDELVETARATEAAGYDILLIRDHFQEEPFGQQFAPIAALSTIAAVTRTLRIGSMVFANDYRPPIMLAKEAATLDVLSSGRFELGIGTGFLRAEYEHAGIPFDAPGVRVARFRESLQMLKGLFTAEPVTFHGEHYTLTDFTSFPKPVQRPHPPIVVGGGGRRMLSIAAREADVIELLTLSTADGTLSRDPSTRLASAVQRQLDWIRGAAGARFDDLELSTVISIVITDHRDVAAEQFARERGWDDIAPEDVLAMPTVFIGSVDQIMAEMRERRVRYGFSYYIVSDRDRAMAAPIVTHLAGT